MISPSSSLILLPSMRKDISEIIRTRRDSAPCACSGLGSVSSPSPHYYSVGPWICHSRTSRSQCHQNHDVVYPPATKHDCHVHLLRNSPCKNLVGSVEAERRDWDGSHWSQTGRSWNQTHPIEVIRNLSRHSTLPNRHLRSFFSQKQGVRNLCSRQHTGWETAGSSR